MNHSGFNDFSTLNITRKNLSVCYTDLKTNQVLFFWATPSSEISKTFGLFPFINMQKQSPLPGFEPATFRLELVFRFLTAPLTQNKTSGSVATRGLAIHAFCALFEENRFRNKELTLVLCAKTSKIRCFSIFDGPLDPKSKIGLRHYTRLCNTQLLRGH